MIMRHLTGISLLATITVTPAHSQQPEDNKINSNSPNLRLPFVINTWGGAFTAATDAAYTHLLSASVSASASNPQSQSQSSISAIEAIEIGCSKCEALQCDNTVGYGGSPDEQCETTLDAMIMDGSTMNTGAVAGLRRIRDAISVARRVLEHTSHSLLVGDLATRFAVDNGFLEEDLSTPESRARCAEWKGGNCQGNFRENVLPDPRRFCGPYTPIREGQNVMTEMPEKRSTSAGMETFPSHDTISMVVIDQSGKMAAGTSTNGASHKIPGRVGDGPIVGSGSYVDGEVGGCGATGDGDIMMRFLPCYQAVENLRRGMTPTEAAEDVVRRMLKKFPAIQSGIVVVNKDGEHGGAASGWTFTYSFRAGEMKATEVVTVLPLGLDWQEQYDL